MAASRQRSKEQFIFLGSGLVPTSYLGGLFVFGQIVDDRASAAARDHVSKCTVNF